MLVAGCAKHAADMPELASTPRVPAPEAGTYARVEAAPPDPVVARLLAGRRYDASLGGAAAGLALAESHGTGGFTPWELREAAWRAGWPYPIGQLRAWHTAAGAAPPPALDAWLAGLAADASVGLVRVRGETADTWVGLAATPAVELGVIRRVMRVGESVQLPPVPAGIAVLVDPAGDLDRRGLDEGAELALDRAGEWVIEVRRGEETLARFPVYADMAPPRIDLFDVEGLPDGAVERAEALVGEIRDIYGAGAWRRDPTLDTVAARALAGPLDVPAALGKLGYDPVASTAWTCAGPTVEACLDSVVWRPEDRRMFLTDARLLGLAVEAGSDRVRIAAVAAPE